MRINAGNLLFELYELFVNSIENSNKSKMLSKRLRYLSDHLTFNCFTQVVKTFLLNCIVLLFLQVNRSLYQKDKRIFTFILCVDMMIYKQQLETKDVDILMTEVKIANRGFLNNDSSAANKD